MLINNIKIVKMSNELEHFHSFSLTSEKNIKYLINISIQSENLFIEAKTTELIRSILYKKKYTLNEIKLNKYFKMCESIKDVFFELKNIIKNNIKNIKILENSNNLILSIPLPSVLIHFQVFYFYFQVQ